MSERSDPVASAELYLDAGRAELAWSALAAYLATNPDDPGALRVAARVQARLGNGEEAARLADRAISLSPDEVETWLAASIAYAVGFPIKAKSAAAECVRRGPNEWVAHYQMAATALIAPQDIPLARRAVADALRLAPQEVEAHVLQGNVELAAGDTPGAELAFSRALRMVPTHPVARHNLAVAALRGGREGKAAVMLASVLRSDPTSALARRNLTVAVARGINRLTVITGGAVVVSLYVSQSGANRSSPSPGLISDVLAAIAATVAVAVAGYVIYQRKVVGRQLWRLAAGILSSDRLLGASAWFLALAIILVGVAAVCPPSVRPLVQLGCIGSLIAARATLVRSARRRA